MLRLLLLLAAFMQAYFNFINFQLQMIAYTLQNIRRRRLIAMAFYSRVLGRRRGRIRRRLWRLPCPVNSWFEVHFYDPTLPVYYFTTLPVRHASLLSGAPKDGFLPNALKRCFKLSGVLLKLCRLILGCAIKFLSVRFF